MSYLLDTNMIIHARDGTESVLDKFAEHDGAVFCSALSYAELQRGLLQAVPGHELRRARLELLLPRIPVFPFDERAALVYGKIIERLGWVRSRDFDRMIAAHAISVGFVLVTANIADFRDIPELQIADWSRC